MAECVRLLRAGREQLCTVESMATATLQRVFELSDGAVAKLEALLGNEEDGTVLVIEARPGGCSGLSWEMFFDHEANLEPGRRHTVAEYGQQPVTVAVDEMTAALATGASLDYRDGLVDSGFKISNPNATNTCGCGQSFS